MHVGPLKDMRPLNAVLRQTRCVGNGTQWESSGFAQHIHRALVAGRDSGEDNTGLTLESFGASVNQGLERVGVIFISHTDQSSVHPATSLNRVQTADDKGKFRVKVLVLVLNLAVVSIFRRKLGLSIEQFIVAK